LLAFRLLDDTDRGEVVQQVLDFKAEKLTDAAPCGSCEDHEHPVLKVAAVSLVIAVGLLAVRSRIANPQLLDALAILAGTMMGGIGAFLSISGRAESIRLDPVAGERIHRIEGMVRVAVGLLGALFLALAIKANLILGLSQTWPHPLLALLIFCIVAGATERLVPGLIKNMESSLSRERKRL